MIEQLTLTHERIARAVAEPDMSPSEIDAATADLLEQIELMKRARPCRCIPHGPLVLDGDGCSRCGRVVA